MLPLPDGWVILAGVEPPGQWKGAPVAGRVKVLASSDLKNWTEHEVDYRAEAMDVLLAAASRNSLWMATDTGMILKLTMVQRATNK